MYNQQSGSFGKTTMTTSLNEKKLLLDRLPRYPTDLVLKLGEEIGEPYCLQFDDSGYDQQNYRYFNHDEAIPKIAELVTDDQLLSFFANPDTKVEVGKITFRGMFYTLKGGELKCESDWPSVKAALLSLAPKHGRNLGAMLEACYEICVKRGKVWDNYLMVESVAKDLGAGKGWRRALTDLQIKGVVAKDKGNIQIPPELIPLVREFLDEFEDRMEKVGETEEEEEQLEIPEDLFDVVAGHDKVKKLFSMSLQAERPVHILLVGPPATAKSIFLMELGRLPRSRYALGGTSSKAGIVDFIIEHRPRYLLIDELEKMDMKDYSALLSLMETGVVTRLKKGMMEEITVKTWVFGAVNRDDSLPPELKSRFYIHYLPEYSEEDYKKVVQAVLIKREGVDEEVAAIIAEKLPRYSRDVRDAVRVARLYGKGQHMTTDQLIDLLFGSRGREPDPY